MEERQEQGDWLAYFQEIPSISAFGDTPQEALEELQTAWEMCKDEYRAQNRTIPIPQNRNSQVA